MNLYTLLRRKKLTNFLDILFINLHYTVTTIFCALSLQILKRFVYTGIACHIHDVGHPPFPRTAPTPQRIAHSGGLHWEERQAFTSHCVRGNEWMPTGRSVAIGYW